MQDSVMINLFEDISTISGINQKYLNKIINIILSDISNSILEAKEKELNTVDINLDFGTLKLEFPEDYQGFTCKFIPAAKLIDTVKSTVTTGTNQLVNNIEKSLVTKLTDLYKDLL